MSEVTLTLDEQETHFHITASDRSKVEVYSDDPVWQRKLEKITQPTKVNGRGKFYELRINQLSIRAGVSNLTDEQRAAKSARMRALRANQMYNSEKTLRTPINETGQETPAHD